MSDIERQCTFLRTLFKECEAGDLPLKLNNVAIILERQHAELEQLRLIARQQHEALVRANNSLCGAIPIDRDQKNIKEYCLAARDCRAAIEKYESINAK